MLFSLFIYYFCNLIYLRFYPVYHLFSKVLRFVSVQEANICLQVTQHDSIKFVLNLKNVQAHTSGIVFLFISMNSKSLFIIKDKRPKYFPMHASMCVFVSLFLALGECTVYTCMSKLYNPCMS